MKRFKIGVTVLAALITMSFTITSRTGIIEGTHAVESIQCWSILTIVVTAYNVNVSDQIPTQTTPGLKTILPWTADLDLAPGAPVLKASDIVAGAIGSQRVRTCAIEDPTQTCCVNLDAQGGAERFQTGIPEI